MLHLLVLSIAFVVVSGQINPVLNGDFSAGTNNLPPPSWIRQSFNAGSDSCGAGDCSLRRRSDFDVVAGSVNPSARISTGRALLNAFNGRRGSDVYQDSVTVCPGSVLSVNVATKSTLQAAGVFFQLIVGANNASFSGVGTEVLLPDFPGIGGGTRRDKVTGVYAGLLGNYSVGVRVTRNLLVDPLVRIYLDNFQITDPENPSISCPALITQSNDAGKCSAAVTFAATASDNCGVVSVTYSQASGSDFPVGTTTVTATATDAAGNSANCSFDVTVVDNEPPVISCPAPITQNNDAGKCSAAVTFAATATDNCNASVTYSQAPGSDFPVGTTTVTATATDAAGNSANCSFAVTVVDNEPPVFTVCPNVIDVSTSCCAGGKVTGTPFSVSDNCPSVTMSYKVGSIWLNQTEFDNHVFGMGFTRIKARATDSAGNIAHCKTTVDVRLCCPAREEAPVDEDAWVDE